LGRAGQGPDCERIEHDIAEIVTMADRFDALFQSLAKMTTPQVVAALNQNP
jgi:hypothetical protein